MKVIAINGSPRKNKNTATMLEHALVGAKSVGAETELIHLTDLKYSGCVSCFRCKLKGGKYANTCAVQDELSPVLEKIMKSDAVILGSPIYLGEVTGMMRNLMERLLFMVLTYNKTESSNRSTFGGKISAAFIYTMGLTKDRATIYDRLYELNDQFLSRLNGRVEHYACMDTYQFDDYSKYDANMFDEKHKSEVRKNQFPLDCKAAYDIGKRLAS